METLYVIFLIISLLVFIIAIFGDFDFMNTDIDINYPDIDADLTDSPGLFSVRTISAFMAGFSISGLIAMHSYHWGIIGQLSLGFGTGIVFALIAYLIMYILYKQQGGELTDSSKFTGMNAIITTATGSQGIGECKVNNKYYTCKESDDLPLFLNETVTIKLVIGSMLIVKKKDNQ